MHGKVTLLRTLQEKSYEPESAALKAFCVDLASVVISAHRFVPFGVFSESQ